MTCNFIDKHGAAALLNNVQTATLKTLDLFSGIGGFALAAKMTGGFETVGFCEIDPYCQKVLSKNFPGVPIHDDIRSLTARTFSSRIDCITAGFPCQDISVANPNGRGLEGERSGLFFELMRVVREIRPRYVVLENVAEMLRKQDGRVMGTVLRELSESGFDAEWQTVSAASVGAPHLRERVFIVAHANGDSHKHEIKGRDREAGFVPSFNWAQDGSTGKLGRASDDLRASKSLHSETTTNGDGARRQKQHAAAIPNTSGHLTGRNLESHWQQSSQPQPAVLRVDDGVSSRMDRNRIRGLGNAVVPQVAVIPLRRVLDLHHAAEVWHES